MRYYRILLLFTTVLLNINSISLEEGRTLVYTSAGIIKLIIGLSMPLNLPVSVSWVQNVQFQYMPLTNATELTYLNVIRKRSNGISFSRTQIYTTLADAWDLMGMNGTGCVLRTICEIAVTPLRHNGILGQILDTIFTPHKKTDSMYKKSRKVGRKISDCSKFHTDCKQSILDLFTILI